MEIQNEKNYWLEESMKFKKGAIRALKTFRTKKTYKEENKSKRLKAMVKLIEDLSFTYEVEPPNVVFNEDPVSQTGSLDSHVICAPDNEQKTIVIRGKLSIITLLHEFAHVIGRDQQRAVRWSLNLFQRVYPKQYDKLFIVRGIAFTTEEQAREFILYSNERTDSILRELGGLGRPRNKVGSRRRIVINTRPLDPWRLIPGY